MQDFIVVYSYPYKSYFDEMSEKYEASSDGIVAYALSKFLDKLEGTMLFSGIDCKGIREEVKNYKKNSFYETLSSLKLRAIARNYSVKKELVETAETYVLFSALTLHNLSSFPKSEEIREHFDLDMAPSPFMKKEGIGLMLRYKDWMVVKKLSYKDVEDYMVAGTLSGIISSITQRFYELLGFSTPKKKSKSWKNLVESMKDVENKEGFEKNFVLYKNIVENGYNAYATLEMLSKAYPSLKPKKPRGRLPK